MSEDASTPDSISADSKPEPVARARKAAVPKVRKTAKAAKGTKAPEPVEVTIPLVADSEPAADESSGNGNDWPEPASAAGGAQGPAEGGKRKRRRRKGKGQGNAAANERQDEDSRPAPVSAESVEQPPAQHRPAHGSSQPQRSKLDPELLAKKAWKIFLAEVSEEGVALIGDNDAKDLSRRCFRLAEIFIEEQTRRR